MKYKNNPLNIRHSSNFTWLGEVANFNGFCVFKSEFYCYRAALQIFRSYRKRNLVTLNGIIPAWAPPSENFTAHYLNFVVSYSRLTISQDIYSCTSYDVLKERLFDILYSMSKFEQGSNYFPNEHILNMVLDKYIKKYFPLIIN